MLQNRFHAEQSQSDVRRKSVRLNAHHAMFTSRVMSPYSAVVSEEVGSEFRLQSRQQQTSQHCCSLPAVANLRKRDQTCLRHSEQTVMAALAALCVKARMGDNPFSGFDISVDRNETYPTNIG
jgi:hypothetical protein